ncbi:MAG TPA: protein kinase [Thermoanaerobaculia bacterium]|nr:protein kinase [Thermoanaerobaculia bacterium]
MEGIQLSQFRILSQLGAGGMGEVWAAEDTRLGRQVALKLLPPAFTADPVRLGRFEREARMLASLNHPSIASIYSFESATPAPGDGPGGGDPVHFLVMELVHGESLEQRLRRGALPLAAALPIARRICEAMEAAHAQGIVHRDLKPGNVMVDPQGRVKVLDFGLAKALAPPDARTSDPQAQSDSPTLTVAMTGAGIVLGTAAYMSPEQATGKTVDKRADIWAFGAILWEMLTGRALFSGDSVAATLADVLRGELDLDSLPPGIPTPLRELLRRCLERDRDRRLHDIADARLVLEDLEAGDWEPAPPAPATRRPLAWASAAAAAGLLVGALGAGWFLRGGAGDTPGAPVRFEIPIPDAARAQPAVSPDGLRIAYISEGRLWVRALDRLEPVPVEGSEGASRPFWSPDGESLGFFAERAVWRVPVTGGRPTLLTEVPPGSTYTGLWLPDDRVLFTTGTGGVTAVPARGGEPRTLIDLLPGEVDFHGLSGYGAGALLAAVHRLEAEQYGNLTVLVGDRRTELIDLPGEMVWSPVLAEQAGWITFERIGHNAPRGVWGVRVELDPPRAVGAPVMLAPGASTPAVRGDTLVYAPAPDVHRNQLVWLDREGEVIERVGEPRLGLYPTPSVSPDGRRAAVAVAQRLGSTLWSVDLATGRFQQVSFDPGSVHSAAAWTPDGEHLYYYFSTGTDDQRIVRKRADASTGVDEVTTGSLEAAVAPDGRTLAFSRPTPGFRLDLWTRDLVTGDESLLSNSDDWDRHPDFSPDGRLIAFLAGGAVTVAAFPPTGERWQIAPSGEAPRWGAQGRHLYYLSGDTLMEAPVDPGPPFRAGEPTPLFTVSISPSEFLSPSFAVAGEGERFLFVVPAGPPPGLVVVRHWARALDG